MAKWIPAAAAGRLKPGREDVCLPKPVISTVCAAINTFLGAELCAYLDAG